MEFERSMRWNREMYGVSYNDCAQLVRKWIEQVSLSLPGDANKVTFAVYLEDNADFENGECPCVEFQVVDPVADGHWELGVPYQIRGGYNITPKVLEILVGSPPVAFQGPQRRSDDEDFGEFYIEENDVFCIEDKEARFVGTIPPVQKEQLSKDTELALFGY